MTRLTVAALQLAFTEDRDSNIRSVSELVREAHSRGAQVVLPPELFEGPYFCREEDESLFANARSVDEHPSVLAMREMAKELKIWIPTSFFEAEGPHHYNSLAMVGPDGKVAGIYRKSHIPDGPGYEEKFYFRPGNDGFKVWDVFGWVEGHATTLEAQQYTYQLADMTPGTYRFRLKQVDFDGTFAYSPEVEVVIGVPDTYQLSTAYPNPFNPQTSFSLSVARAQRVEIGVFDLLGRRVAQLHNGLLEAGTTTAFTFEAGGLPSGLYLIRAVGEQFLASQRITLLK